MSYCRIGDDSDVYVICSSKYEITVLGNKLHYVRDTPQEALDVLESLTKIGYKVPQYATARLQKEIEK